MLIKKIHTSRVFSRMRTSVTAESIPTKPWVDVVIYLTWHRNWLRVTEGWGCENGPFPLTLALASNTAYSATAHTRDVMLARYGLDCRLLFTDTDSFCYSVQTDDLYDDMTTFLEHLATSSYPNDHPLYTSQKAKVLGKFKDKCNAHTDGHCIKLKYKLLMWMPHFVSHVARGFGRVRLCVRACTI